MDAKTFLQNKRNDVVELQKMLTSHIAIAPEGGGDGESEKCDALEKWLFEHGFKNIEKIKVPDERVTCGYRPSLIVTIPGEDDIQRIWVMSHIDVVPPGDLSLWDTNPWKVVEKEGRLYGRGVEDNQQGLCSSIFAAFYFMEQNILPSHTVKLLFVADEENGSVYGISWLLKHSNFITKNDFVLIPDGGDKKGETIEIAEKNLLWLKIHIIGKQTHGSRPDNGANACLAACELSLVLHDLESVFNKKDDLFDPNYSTFQPTKREKNVDSINIIPGDDTFYMDCRILPCYSLNDVLVEIDKCCKLIEKKHDVVVKYETPQLSESPATSKNSLVAKKLASAIISAQGVVPKFVGIGGGTVGAELRRFGIDAVVWSTLDDQAHQPNEYCIIDNLFKDSMTMIEFFK